MSDETTKEDLNYWTVPFYDTKRDLVSVIVWNSKNDNTIDVVFLINNEKVINIEKVSKFQWVIRDVSPLNEFNSLITIVNGKIKNEIIFNDELKQVFKKTSYSEHQ